VIFPYKLFNSFICYFFTTPRDHQLNIQGRLRSPQDLEVPEATHRVPGIRSRLVWFLVPLKNGGSPPHLPHQWRPSAAACDLSLKLPWWLWSLEKVTKEYTNKKQYTVTLINLRRQQVVVGIDLYFRQLTLVPPTTLLIASSASPTVPISKILNLHVFSWLFHVFCWFYGSSLQQSGGLGHVSWTAWCRDLRNQFVKQRALICW